MFLQRKREYTIKKEEYFKCREKTKKNISFTLRNEVFFDDMPSCEAEKGAGSYMSLKTNFKLPCLQEYSKFNDGGGGGGGGGGIVLPKL